MEANRMERWLRISTIDVGAEAVRALRMAIVLVCEAPEDAVAVAELRARADAASELIAPLLAAEARQTRDPAVLAILHAERDRVLAALGTPDSDPVALRAAHEREPERPELCERLAWACYLAGAWTHAGEALEQLARLHATGARASGIAIAALRAAGRLYRNAGRTDRALIAYRALAVRQPSDVETLALLAELINTPPTGNPSFDPQELALPVPAPAAPPTVTETEATANPRRKRPTSGRLQVFDKLDFDEVDARFELAFGEPRVFEAEAGSVTEVVVDLDDSIPPTPMSVLPPSELPRLAKPPAGSSPATRLPAGSSPAHPLPASPPPARRAATEPGTVASTPVVPEEARGGSQAPTPAPIARIAIAPLRAVTPPAIERISVPQTGSPRKPTPMAMERIEAGDLRRSPTPRTMERIELDRDEPTDPRRLPALDPDPRRTPTPRSMARIQLDDAETTIRRTPPPPAAPATRKSATTADVAAIDLDAIDEHTPPSDMRLVRDPGTGMVVPPEVARAIEDAKQLVRAGKVRAAEDRLRGLVRAFPLEPTGHLALVDLLRANKRYDDAADYLDEVLLAVDASAKELRAALVHRYALVAAAADAFDEAHEMLCEAKRLDPASLPIALALGESYFARGAFQEAAHHLGALADHPDVAHHTRAVARGLVHAAEAETRLQRADRATEHYEAALEIDPGCAAARTALATRPRTSTGSPRR